VGAPSVSPPIAARDRTDLSLHSIYADRTGGHVAAFLKEEPAWWQHGIWRFTSPLASVGEPDLYVFSHAADRAFTKWLRRQYGTAPGPSRRAT
jgi:hypothetical protein